MICRLFATAVLQLLEQYFLLLQQLVLLALEIAPVGDVLHAEQNGRVGAPFVEHLAGVQAHRASSEVGELVLDLVALHHALLGDDLLQEHAKPWNVPLSVAQGVKKPAFGVLGADPESRIEGATRGDHAQILVENENGLPDSVDDALGECPGIRNRRESFQLIAA